MLRDLRGESPSPFGGWNTSGPYWFTSAVGYFEKRIVGLTRQKSEVARREERAEKAALSTEREARLL